MVMADNNGSANEAVEHIGNAAHGKRNGLLAAGVLGAGALIGLFYWQGNKSNDAAIVALQSFRSAMATDCKSEQFARPLAGGLGSLYADSSRMQAVVVEQLGILRRGQPNCDQIIKALKSVDYPIE
jgi:predicted negative regulator of RcsB-dependent stress response